MMQMIKIREVIKKIQTKNSNTVKQNQISLPKPARTTENRMRS